jgi:predicted AAA+ superfamily ATPase
MPRRVTPKWRPSPDDILDVVREQNPWLENGEVPRSLALPKERAVVAPLASAVERDDPRRFRLILGPRRVGKTTAMYQMVQRLLARGIDPHQVQWLRLDHPLLIDVGLDGLIRPMIERTGASAERLLYLFLDEITYAEKWDLWLKTAYDERWPVRITATSSAVAALRDKRMESGIGRWEEHHLPPYLFNEYLELVEHEANLERGDSLIQTLEMLSGRPQPRGLHPNLRRFLFTGGFPELLLRVGGPAEDETTALLESQRTLKADAVDRVVWKPSR